MTGKDPTFAELMEAKAIPVGRNSTQGVRGSTIDVDNERVEKGPTAENPIPQDIRIHTLGNSSIQRGEFGRWSRWYQEDGNTQVFRLFKGEHNVRNDRPNAARIEAFSNLRWQRGDWHEFEATYYVVRAHRCAIFQAKNNKNDWSIQLNLTDDGHLVLNHREHQEDVVIMEDVVGKHFLVKVRDNGHDYEVFLNRRKVGEGHYARPEGFTSFRWGMYVGGKTLVNYDTMLFVIGARFEKVTENVTE